MNVIDASQLLLGRFATRVAKMALLGEKVVIINCEKAYISGDKVGISKRYKRRQDRGVPLKGPYIGRSPDRLVRRTIRGMLPHRQARGREAFGRIMTYLGVPEEFKDKNTLTFEDCKITKLPHLKHISLQDVARHIGATRRGEQL